MIRSIFIVLVALLARQPCEAQVALYNGGWTSHGPVLDSSACGFFYFHITADNTNDNWGVGFVLTSYPLTDQTSWSTIAANAITPSRALPNCNSNGCGGPGGYYAYSFGTDTTSSILWSRYFNDSAFTAAHFYAPTSGDLYIPVGNAPQSYMTQWTGLSPLYLAVNWNPGFSSTIYITGPSYYTCDGAISTPAPVAGYATPVNFDYPGSDLLQTTSYSTPAACAAQCNIQNGCVGFTWVIDTTGAYSCNLKSAMIYSSNSCNGGICFSYLKIQSPPPSPPPPSTAIAAASYTGLATRTSVTPSACVAQSSCAYLCSASYTISATGSTLTLTPGNVGGCTCYSATGTIPNSGVFSGTTFTFQDSSTAAITSGICQLSVVATTQGVTCTGTYAISGTSVCPASSPSATSSPANTIKSAAGLVAAAIVAMFI